MSINKLATKITLVLAVCMGSMFSAQAQEPLSSMVLDEILLKDGSRILGTVTGARDGVLSVDTSFAGTLQVGLDQIEAVRTGSDAVIMLNDSTVLRDTPLTVRNGQLVVSNEQSPASSYPLETLQIVNPEPWELGNGYRATGLANLALVMQRGNTESDELNYNLEAVWRSTQDRYTFLFSGENDEANGEKNADNWQATGKYDYFLEGPNYWGVQAFVEQDQFADLDLRWLVGPYVGRQLYADPLFNMSAEVGFSYVDEDFIVADDRDYVAGNWSLHGDSNYLGGDSRLYFAQTGIWNLQETSDVIINTTLGVAFPLLWNLEGAAELVFDYDSGAMGDIDKLDQTYRFRVGYGW